MIRLRISMLLHFWFGLVISSNLLSYQPLLVIYVIYWPSTEPSIKRCTCVNKRKNSGSRWTLNNNITSTQMVWVCWRHAEVRATGRERAIVEQPSQVEKEVLLAQYNSLSPSPTHLSHTTNITLSRIKYERYIFIKKCVCSFIEVHHYVWLCSEYICICMCICI